MPVRIFRLREDHGAVIVVVAIVTTLMFGVAALAIDAGHLWSSRRGLITATDAAALAGAAQALGSTSNTCTTPDPVSETAVQAAATAELNDNQPSATGTVSMSCNGDSGEVTVTANQPVNLQFAPAVGVNGHQSVGSLSVAEFGSLAQPAGLRPIGICYQNPNFLDWEYYGANPPTSTSSPGFTPQPPGVSYTFADPYPQGDPDENPAYLALAGTGLQTNTVADYGADYPATNQYGVSYYAQAATLGPTNGNTTNPQHDVVSRLNFTQLSPSTPCGSSTGNWGYIDFNTDVTAGTKGPAGTGPQLNTWLTNGYSSPVTVTDVWGGGQGAKAGTSAGFASLLCPPSIATPSCPTFGILVYSSIGGGHGGDGVTFQGFAALCVALRDYSLPSGYLDLEFLSPGRCDLQGSGIVGGSNPLGLKGITLCGGAYGGTVDNKCGV
jgi:Flp pilus assembly protein TadG